MKPIEKQTKAELIKTVDILRRHEARLLRDIEKLTSQLAVAEMRHQNKPLAFEAEREIRKHTTPVPANVYGTFPWEPKK